MRKLSGGFILIVLFFGCSVNDVKTDNSLKHFFDENKAIGTFALLNNGTVQFTIYNLKRYRDSSYLPASTFDILTALIGLQTGKISSDTMLINWDGVERSNKEWNKTLKMNKAFSLSAVPYFQEIARRIGKDTIKHWVDSVSYGTKKITSNVDTFWLDNSLKITPDEQLGLIKKLYFRQLPFFVVVQQTIKDDMILENDSNYKLSLKTGFGFTEKGNLLGWALGWVEENRHPYFFVLNFELTDKNTDMQAVGLSMLKGILRQLGFMQGKM